MNALTTFDSTTRNYIIDLMQAQHVRMAQLDLPYSQRSISASNYDSAIRALGEYLAYSDQHLPR